jgi:hypothetical protein
VHRDEEDHDLPPFGEVGPSGCDLEVDVSCNVDVTYAERSGSGRWVGELEFLTHETTCPSKMLEKTTCEKDPLRVAAPLARRHMARAAWASDGRPLPPLGWALPPSSLPAR